MDKRITLQQGRAARSIVRFLFAAVLLGALLLSGKAVLAQTGLAAADWWTFSSGGGPQTVVGVTLDGTVGQMVVGDASAGNTGLSSGYWGRAPSKTVSKDQVIYLPFTQR